MAKYDTAKVLNLFWGGLDVNRIVNRVSRECGITQKEAETLVYNDLVKDHMKKSASGATDTDEA